MVEHASGMATAGLAAFVASGMNPVVGVVAAAYYSYSGYNDAITIGMIDAIWPDPGIFPDFGSGGSDLNYSIGAGNDIFTMGDVINQGLYAICNQSGLQAMTWIES